MSDIHNAPAGGDGVPAPAAPTPADTSPITTRDAARALSEARWKRAKEQPAAVEPAPPEQASEPPQELAETPIDAQPPADPVETTQAPEPAELPPIEPPRSWTSEEKDRFKSYPRELQAYLSEREQQRDRELRTRQNEAADIRKAAEAERTKAEQARQQYEAQLPAALQALQELQAGQFADIKSQADLDRLATDDPFRFIQWQAHQQKVAAAKNEAQAAQQRQAQEWEAKWVEFAKEQDKLVGDHIPELADPAQRAKVQESALSYLKDIGFKDQELGSAWNGQASLSLRDHRLQVLIRDAVKGREMQAAAKKAIPAKPLPPVQRPGVAAPRGAANDQAIQTLSKKLDSTGNLRDAAALLAARRAART